MDPVVVVVRPDHQPIYLLVREPLVLGRECEGLVLDDPQVSRRHLELRPGQNGVLVTDLDSTNGTFLDGMRLDAPLLLEPGMRITMGETTLRLIDVPSQPGTTGVGRRTEITVGDGARRTSIDVVAELVDGDWSPRPDIGTITIVFSDIESSTERVSEIGDVAWTELLEHHNRVFRSELARSGGREVKSVGDGFMLTFGSVRRALAFTRAVQQRLAAYGGDDRRKQIRVRMGLHTGEAISDATGDLFGRHVNKAARIANLASGAQVLVSATVREIAAGDHEASFGAPVEVELKGLEGTHVVHDYLWNGSA